MANASATSAARLAAVPISSLARNAMRRLDRRRWLLALLLCMGYGTCILAYSASGTCSPAENIAEAYLWSASLAVTLLVALTIAEGWPASCMPHWVAYAFAAAVAAFVSAMIGVAAVNWLGLASCNTLSPSPSFGAAVVVAFFANSLLCVVAALTLAHHHDAQKRLAVLRRAQLASANLLKRTHKARLQAMQARVEPGFLFSTLAHVEKLYDEDPGRGNLLLDELIAYLRTALPHLRKSTSTLAKEIELARAYLTIAAIRFDDRVRWHIGCPRRAENAGFPPMLLLPLIDHAIAGGTAPPGEPTSITAIDIDVTIAATHVRLVLRHSDRRGADRRREDGLGEIRSRLHALYGERAQLAVSPATEGRAEVAVVIPS